MHEPTRECVGCGGKFSKRELLRIVKKEDDVILDKTGKSEGRGAYICKNSECLEMCIKRKKLNRAFRQNVPLEAYIKIEEEMRRLLE